MIVIGNLMAVPRERSRRKVTIITRKALLNGASEHSLVARAGHLLIIGQAGRVAIDGLAHAECAGLLGHYLREGVFIPADLLADRARNVVGGARHDGFDRILDR